MQRTAKTQGENTKNSAVVFFQVALGPLIAIVPVAGILIWGVGLEPAGRLTRGISYASLFLVCVALGRWRFSLQSIGLARKNIGRGFIYAIVVLIAGLGLMLAVQPPEGLADIGPMIWSPILFYLAVALAEETWFRGLIFKALHDWRGATLAVFGSAALFGLMHVPTHGWQGLLFSLSIGLPYAVVRLRTNNILGLITVHWLTNLTDSFIRLSPASLETLWLVLLHILVFSGTSIAILVLDRRLILHRDAVR